MIGILLGIGALLTKATALVTAIAPKLIPWMVNGAKTLLNVFKTNLPKIINTVDSVSDILNIIDKNIMNSEEIGLRAANTDKKPEDFDTIEEYIKHLEEDIEVDKGNLKEEDRVAYSAIGASISIRAIEEKLSMNINPEFWVEATRNNLSSEEIMKILEKYKDSDSELNFDKYCKGELSSKEEAKTGELLVEAFKDLYPTKSNEDIESKIMEFEKNSQLKKEIE